MTKQGGITIATLRWRRAVEAASSVAPTDIAAARYAQDTFLELFPWRCLEDNVFGLTSARLLAV